MEEMNNLKAIAIDESIPLYIRTAINAEVQQGMKELKMKVPGKVIVDGRFKARRISHKPGRPRKVDPKKYQLPLIRKGII